MNHITRVVMQPGPGTQPIATRFADNDLHGFENTGATEFECISVTSSPVNFRSAYAKDWSAAGPKLTGPGIG